MFGLGPMELIIVLIIVLILFGGKKLPQIGDGMGRAIRNFRKSIAAEGKCDPEKVAQEIADHARTEKSARSLP